MGYKYLQKIKNSPNFGRLLPIDYNPYHLRSIQEFPAEDIFYEIKTFEINSGQPDYIWLKAPNESFLYPGLKRLIKLIKLEFPEQKIGLYANSVLFQYKEVREDFQECDLIAINLNSIDPSNFEKVCGCNVPVKLEDVKEGIKKFSKNFEGKLFIYTLFLKGNNDTQASVRELKDFLLEINPDSLSIGEFVEGSFESTSHEFKGYVKKYFQEVPFNVSFKF